MEFPDSLPAELQGELQMLEAMYSESLTISQTDLEKLHRIRSDEIISYSSSRQTSKTLGETSNDFLGGGGSPPASPNTRQAGIKNEERTIVTLTLRNNVEIELTFPTTGYYVDDNNRVKMRIDVLRTPHGIDSELLLQEMKQVLKVHTVGEGSLIISICQAAEQFVEAAVANAGSSSSSSEDQEDTNNENEDDQLGMMTAASSSSSRQPSTNAMMMTTTSSSGGVIHDGSDSAIWQELQKRGCVRGTNVIHDRKSKFLAHAAPISSEKEAKEIVSLLREMKSIAVACHPTIWAYKFQNPLSKVVHYDCDDDGEKNGEKNIQFVLDNLKVCGWIVVVTRYFGGIHLQADRFRHIATVTRDVLVEAGAVPTTSATTETKKK